MIGENKKKVLRIPGCGLWITTSSMDLFVGHIMESHELYMEN